MTVNPAAALKSLVHTYACRPLFCAGFGAERELDRETTPSSLTSLSEWSTVSDPYDRWRSGIPTPTAAGDLARL